MKFLIHNFVQYLRPKLDDVSFKEILDNLNLYLLWKYPPKCVFEMEKLLSNSPGDMGFNRQNQLNIDLKNSNWLYEVDMKLNLAEC